MADHIFTEAPEEVVRYFDAKGTVPSFDWRELAPHEHAVGFTVAKSAGFDVLDDIRRETRKAIAEFKDFGSFADELEPILRRKGWWGRKIVEGPSGKQVVQLGSLHRLRTIYWANTTTARAAGEWERIQRTKRGLPFLIYELSVAEKKRPEHQNWVGVILPVDHTFWATHYPPNGWLCQCRVRQITRREAERLGYDPETPGPQVVTKPWRNKVTGETHRVPEGIDPGWHTNPGATRARNVRTFLGDRLDALPDMARKAAVRDVVGSPQFRAMQAGDLPYGGAADRSPANLERGSLSLPVGMLTDRLKGIMGAKTRQVVLSNADAHKQLRKRVTKGGAQQLSAADYAKLQAMIEEGQVFQEQTMERDVILQMMFEGKPWHAVLRMTRDGSEIYLKSFRRANRIGGERFIELD